MSTEQLLKERQRTHGNFADHAACTQDLKHVFRMHVELREAANRPQLTRRHIESIEMILHKIGRIVAGDPYYDDHWDDIAGYAKIANCKVTP